MGNVTSGGNTMNGGSQSLTVGGDTYIAPKPSAAGAYAPDARGPLMTCRIFVGLGATIREGSLSGGIPVGNDQTCMSDANLRFMDKVNSVKPGTFGAADYLRAVCKAEGMADLEGCKAVATKTVAAPAVIPTAVVVAPAVVAPATSTSSGPAYPYVRDARN